MIEIPNFSDKFDLFDWLYENKDLHIADKKRQDKRADAVQVSFTGDANKDRFIDPSTIDKMEVESIINTTKVMDSHSDVHIDSLWNKSLRRDKNIFLLQEHEMKFDKIISDVVKATAENRTWKSLGFGKFKGETQALVFKSIIEKSRNEFMFNQYAKGFVKNHSVGMRYIKLELAVNNDTNDYKEEFDVWNKYIDTIVNRKDVEDQGFFWAVKEARVIEGSAVVKGSNPLTPTSHMEAKEQLNNTPDNEQSNDTQKMTNLKSIILNN